MSTCLWCDKGNHAFKGGEPGSQQFQGSQVGPDGRDTNMMVNVCAEHAMASLSPELQARQTP